jgi:hypothetical protein
MPFTRPPYAHLRASLLTQHGKEKVICPEMLETCHLEVLHVTGYDTDQLGTFTRDVARKGSQLDAARAKARKGMALSGAEIGIASEGSFTNDPFTGLLPWNLELILLIDDKHAIQLSSFSLIYLAFKKQHLLFEYSESSRGWGNPRGGTSHSPKVARVELKPPYP